MQTPFSFTALWFTWKHLGMFVAVQSILPGRHWLHFWLLCRGLDSLVLLGSEGVASPQSMLCYVFLVGLYPQLMFLTTNMWSVAHFPLISSEQRPQSSSTEVSSMCSLSQVLYLPLILPHILKHCAQSLACDALWPSARGSRGPGTFCRAPCRCSW